MCRFCAHFIVTFYSVCVWDICLKYYNYKAWAASTSSAVLAWHVHQSRFGKMNLSPHTLQPLICSLANNFGLAVTLFWHQVEMLTWNGSWVQGLLLSQASLGQPEGEQLQEMGGTGFALKNNSWNVCVSHQVIYLTGNSLNLNVDYVSLGREEMRTLGKGQADQWGENGQSLGVCCAPGTCWLSYTWCPLTLDKYMHFVRILHDAVVVLGAVNWAKWVVLYVKTVVCLQPVK